MYDIYTSRYESPCGELLLGAHAGQLCLCDWAARGPHAAPLRRLKAGLRTGFMDAAADGGLDAQVVLSEACRQLDEYFAGRRHEFSIPLLMIGTPFQRCVWECLLSIPYGTTLSYAKLAERMGKPTAVRAVAGAVGANGLSIFAPCHRVVGADGLLTGYAGGIGIKRFLLQLEGVLPETKAPHGDVLHANPEKK